MTYAARVVADSISPEHLGTLDTPGVRLTTLEVTMPRIVLAEFNTHRVFSRNSASSRAIPVEKRIAAIRENPFVPEAFGANKKGMQAGDALDEADQEQARNTWLSAMANACSQAQVLAAIGVHKQWANRIIEPYSWTTVVVTATEWDNFFALRISPEAQPEIRRVAELMKTALEKSEPERKYTNTWHLPYVYGEDWSQFPQSMLVRLSCARAARVSYLTHDGRRDPAADFELYDRLLASGHMSPFEHAARVVSARELVTANHEFGNFRAPWLQHRKQIAGEAVFGAKP